MLPIGSIVHVKGHKQKLMILNRGPEITQDGETKMYDYSACLYPYGLDPKKVYYFDEEDIEEIIFEGYRDEDEMKFLNFYKKWLEKSNTPEKEKDPA